MAEQYYNTPRKVDFGGDEIEIEVKRGKHALKNELRNYFSNYALDRETGMFEGVDIPAGAIENIAVRRCLEKMVHNGVQVQFVSNSPIEDYPDVGMGDEEGDKDLYEEVLKTIVDKTRFLARQYPFNMVFAQYLALVNADKQEYEKNRAKATGTKPDVPPNPEDESDEVGPNPTVSPEDTSTVRRIPGSEL